MKKLITGYKTIALVTLALLFLSATSVFAQSQVVDYLCELGKSFYAQGKTEDALSEFNKVLAVDPENKTAKAYIGKIFASQNSTPDIENPVVLNTVETPIADILATQPPLTPIEENVPTQSDENKILTKDDAMEEAMSKMKNGVSDLDRETPAEKDLNKNVNKDEQKKAVAAYLYGYPDLIPIEEPVDRGIKLGPIKITGEAQLSFGVTPSDFIWKQANYNLNEKYFNWRTLSNAGLNRGMNTFDTRVYDSLSVNADTENEEGFNFHINLTVDPWSFTGKSHKFTVTDAGGDPADLQLYYLSNSGYTVDRTAYGLLNGSAFNVPELKVKNGKTSPTTVITNSAEPWLNFDLPEEKIERQFQPVRELWLDYTNDQIKFRVFPMAYQDQAYSSDDPMGITNRHIWWQDSPWLRSYQPGAYRSGISSFTKGKWDDSLSFISKDSTGKYLTALRGFSFSFSPSEQTTFDTTAATPKNLWQDYSTVDNVISASRLKHFFTDNFMLGGTLTSRTGFKTDPQKVDSENLVGGVDLGYEFIEGMKASAEVLTSKSWNDMTSDDYKTESEGNAYYFSFISRYPLKSIMDLKYGYDEIALGKDENFLIKSKFYLSRIDKEFDSSLSNFSNTRQDTDWSRHIHFRRPMEYYYQGLTKPADASKWGELNATRIGDGMDKGRSVLGFRFETFLDDKFYNLFDIRNVHDNKGNFIENVVRDELSVRVTDKLTAKVLGIYQKLPNTTAGVDPFVYDGNTGAFFMNDDVLGGQDPSIITGSLGLNYDFFDWLSVDGIYERTNDYTLGYANFPRNVYNNYTNLWGRYTQNDKLYNYTRPLLYSQGNFPQAPYDFYNIYKMGARISPLDNMDIYVDYTRNEFEAASLNSDNMNHFGLEMTYMPAPKFGMLLKYIYSRCDDVGTSGLEELSGHHNFYSEFRYLPTKDQEIILQYGEGNSSAIGNLNFDPYGGSMLTLDTQHIIRAYYRRKF
jgi:hypothetical protein